MKIIHTSDWHLGKSLYGKKREEEHEKFLAWFLEFLEKEKPDVLLIAGDIFDNANPSLKAEELYFDFLAKAYKTRMGEIVVIGGNHDSPAHLKAPSRILKALNIRIIPGTFDKPEEQVFILKNREGLPGAILCAIPYLRDFQIRNVEEGETGLDKSRKLREGITAYYRNAVELAKKIQKDENLENLPIIATGHLFAQGGKIIEGDGVRDLYVGTLAEIQSEDFPAEIDYLALGHLHQSQKVGNLENFRYCGSPIPMSFAETDQQKEILSVEFKGKIPSVSSIPIPIFKTLLRVKKPWDEISDELKKLKDSKPGVWIEIESTTTPKTSYPRDFLDEFLKETPHEILRIKPTRPEKSNSAIPGPDQLVELKDFTPEEVFLKRLDGEDISPDEFKELREAFQTTLDVLNNREEVSE